MIATRLIEDRLRKRSGKPDEREALGELWTPISIQALKSSLQSPREVPLLMALPALAKGLRALPSQAGNFLSISWRINFAIHQKSA